MIDLDFEQYTDLFEMRVPKAEKKDSITLRGRCPVCGDSKRDRNKKRFYLLKGRGSYPHVVKCHNCGYKTSAQNFFKEYFPDDINGRLKGWKERDLSSIANLKESGYKVNRTQEKDKPDDYFIKVDEDLKLAKKVMGNFFDEFTRSIHEDLEAVNYMRGRNIPNHYIDEMKLLKPEFHDFKTFRFAYFRDYVIIPFIDADDNKPYYFHSRRYRNLDNKRMTSYLMCPYRTKNVEVKFFLNEYRVYSDESIVIAEGTIDALNLPNSIAINGIHKITEEQIEIFEERYGKDIIYALDNEMIDKDAREKAEDLLRLEKSVFLWSKLAEDFPSVSNIKDFNKLCCVSNKIQVPMAAIKKYTRNNISALL